MASFNVHVHTSSVSLWPYFNVYVHTSIISLWPYFNVNLNTFIFSLEADLYLCKIALYVEF